MEMRVIKRVLVYRVYTLLYHIEGVLQALTCEAVVTRWHDLGPGRGCTLDFYVRWWHPAAWIGWVRVNLLHDRVCLAFYGRKGTQG